MYICPTCNREFKKEEEIQKHFLSCWKEQHPHHKSKEAHHSENITTSIGNENILTFLKGVNNGRSKN